MTRCEMTREPSYWFYVINLFLIIVSLTGSVVGAVFGFVMSIYAIVSGNCWAFLGVAPSAIHILGCWVVFTVGDSSEKEILEW